MLSGQDQLTLSRSDHLIGRIPCPETPQLGHEVEFGNLQDGFQILDITPADSAIEVGRKRLTPEVGETFHNTNLEFWATDL